MRYDELSVTLTHFPLTLLISFLFLQADNTRLHHSSLLLRFPIRLMKRYIPPPVGF